MELPVNGPEDSILGPSTNGPRIVADPRLHIGCSVWATDALSGTTYQDLTARVFDDSGRLQLGTTSWLSWHWRETAILGGTGICVMALALVWRRRRPQRRNTPDAEPGPDRA